MKHQRLASSESISTLPDSLSRARNKKWKLAIIGTVAIILLLVAGASVGILVRSRNAGSGLSEDGFLKPTQAISRTCGHTRNEDLCVQSLLSFPGSQFANERKLVDIAVNVSLLHVGKAIDGVSEINNIEMKNLVRSAYEDCLELLQDSADQLSRSLQLSVAGGSSTDVMTWLSAALTNHDTCSEGFSETRIEFKTVMESRLKNVAELISNSLAIYSVYGIGTGEGDLTGIPIQNRRRKLLENGVPLTNEDGFPTWVRRKERKLLQVPVTQIHADYVVAQDGSGNFKTITEAIKAAPEHSSHRIVIYVKSGRYEENILKVGRKKTNLMFIGDGKGKTVITGGKNIFDNITTFRTATFAATGAGFMARDMTFENYAGPGKHQAVALRVGADHSVIYRCNIIGYQDTLYVHSQRQFYRECDIYGTVDFIFGNAAVVFQKCNIFARKPLPNQKNTITAQNRKDPNQNTGISIHDCRLLPAGDLVPVKGSIRTYLGRPWKLYSRVVYMLTYMGDHIDQGGWLEWNGNFALDTLYYGEYMNYGPGAAIGKRVTWKGYRVIAAEAEAAKFTVAQFIYGSSWLPSFGVAFAAGLTR